MYTLERFFFIKFINGLVERYPELFEGGGTSSQLQYNFGKKWKGYSSLVELAQNDVTKLDEITKQPLEKCLLMLAYRSDKNELENLLHKEAMKNIRS